MTSKLGAQNLLATLCSGDGGMVLGALGEIEGTQPHRILVEVLHTAAEQAQDPIQRFQIRKTYRLTALRLQGKAPVIKADMISRFLETPDRLEDLALAIASLEPAEAMLATDVLRQSAWHNQAPAVLPTFCQFFRDFGGTEDVQALLELCRHPDPTVLTAALTAMERIDPANLHSIILPLLSSPIPGVRAQAIRSFYRWDKPAALQHLQRMLLSPNNEEKALALHHAAALPYPEIEPHLLRLVVENDDPKVLMKISQIMKAHVHEELPFKLYWASRSLKDQHQNLVKGIILGLARALADLHIISVSAQDFLTTLKLKVRKEEERLLRASISVAPDPDTNQGKVQSGGSEEIYLPSLADLDEVLVPDSAMSARMSRAGSSPQTESIPEAAAAVPAPETADTFSLEDFDTLAPSAKVQCLSRMNSQGYAKFQPRIGALLKSAKGKELAALVKMIGRFGSSADTAIIKPLLASDDPNEVCAAISALSNLDSEHLSVYLPQLMQHRNGKIRMHATRAFVGIDRESIKRLISSLLMASSSRQRALAAPVSMLVDFSLVREALLAAYEKEKVPELIEKLGLVLCANPDREIFRAIFRISRQADAALKENKDRVTIQMAEKLSVALNKIASPTELLNAEEEAWQAEQASHAAAAQPAAVPARTVPAQHTPSVKEILISDKEEAKAQRGKLTIVVYILAAVTWGAAISYLLVQAVFGE